MSTDAARRIIGCAKEAVRVAVCVNMAHDLQGFDAPLVGHGPRTENSDKVPKGYPGGDMIDVSGDLTSADIALTKRQNFDD
jgi:hypothetical protein